MREYKILITQYGSYEELLEDAYGNLDYDEVKDLLVAQGYDEDEAMYLIVAEYTEENLEEVNSGRDLEFWWRRNGWTLDRGYGGPNYKERLADSIDWDLLFDTIVDVTDINISFGVIALTPVEINDWVIFGYDELISEYEEEEEEEEEDLI